MNIGEKVRVFEVEPFDEPATPDRDTPPRQDPREPSPQKAAEPAEAGRV
jgi:hypothetical protein